MCTLFTESYQAVPVPAHVLEIPGRQATSLFLPFQDDGNDNDDDGNDNDEDERQIS